MRKRRKRSKSCATLIVIIAGLTLCLLTFSGLSWLTNLPAALESSIGPASDSLSSREKYSLAFDIWRQSAKLNSPLDAAGSVQPFGILAGDTADDVILNLYTQGFIANQSLFRKYLIYTGLERNIQAGTYELSSAMTPVEISKAILDATPKLISFGILAGWRLEEIAAALPTSGLDITPAEFLAAAQQFPSGYSFSGILTDEQTIEGFLLPGVYELPRDVRAPELIKIILNRLESSLTEEIRTGLSKQGLSIREGIIIASIVEREAVVTNEQALIASVFLNRYVIGMKLEADPTVQYALGYNQQQLTWWTNPLSSANLAFDAAFNTYIYAGLPPGPISNPSLEAILAVAFPAETTFYYFRAACDGSGLHNFSETYQQHVNFGC